MKIDLCLQNCPPLTAHNLDNFCAIFNLDENILTGIYDCAPFGQLK